jgi:ethanolamine utilization microcompartment shell protein EutS
MRALEKLTGALVLFGSLARIESAQVFALAGLGVRLPPE